MFSNVQNSCYTCYNITNYILFDIKFHFVIMFMQMMTSYRNFASYRNFGGDCDAAPLIVSSWISRHTGLFSLWCHSLTSRISHPQLYWRTQAGGKRSLIIIQIKMILYLKILTYFCS